MDSSSGRRPKVAVQREKQMPLQHHKNQSQKKHKNEGDEAEHRMRRRTAADLSSESESELIGNSARDQRPKIKKMKAIDQVSG